MRHNFYGQNIDTPLSLANNKPGWENSILGRLYAESGGAVHLLELDDNVRLDNNTFISPYAWRVVDAYYSQEDSLITYFRAYDVDGSPIAHPVFGVTWDGCPHTISGGFKFRPAAGNKYYVPIENKFVTPAAGGYRVTVLDMTYPSESFGFGMDEEDGSHQTLVISFRKFELRPGYPNDLGLAIR